MTYVFKIGYGETATTGTIDFLSESVPMKLASGIQLPSPKLNAKLVGVNRDGQSLIAKDYDNRVITALFHMFRPYTETDMSDIRVQMIALNKMLEDAANYHITGKGTIVRVAYQAESTSTLIYFDVIYGEILPYKVVDHKLWIQGLIPNVELSLVCAPFGHAAKVKFRNNISTIYSGFIDIDVNDVPGDIPAPLELYVYEDASSSGYMQQLLVSNYHAGLGGTPSNKSWTPSATLVTAAYNASQAETNSFNGSTVVRHTVQSEWAAAAYIQLNTNIIENSGLMRLLFRIKDNTGIPPPSWIDTHIVWGGTLTSGTYYYRVTARNATGETLPTQTKSATTQYWYKTARVDWSAAQGATNGYRVYRKLGTTGTEQYRDVAAGTLTLLDTGGLTWTNGSPPSETTAVAPVAAFRVKYGLANAALEWDELLATEQFQVSVGGGKWELIDPGIIFPLAAIQGVEHASNPGWIAYIECKLASSGTGTVDIDGAICLPYHGETAIVATRSNIVDSFYDWSIAQRNNGRLDGYLHTSGAGDDIVIQTKRLGQLYAYPGNNNLFLTASKTSGEHSMLSKFVFYDGWYTPRFKDIG